MCFKFLCTRPTDAAARTHTHGTNASMLHSIWAFAWAMKHTHTSQFHFVFFFTQIERTFGWTISYQNWFAFHSTFFLFNNLLSHNKMNCDIEERESGRAEIRRYKSVTVAILSRVDKTAPHNFDNSCRCNTIVLIFISCLSKNVKSERNATATMAHSTNGV